MPRFGVVEEAQYPHPVYRFGNVVRVREGGLYGVVLDSSRPDGKTWLYDVQLFRSDGRPGHRQKVVESELEASL